MTAISGTPFGAGTSFDVVSREVSRGIFRAISGVVFEAIMKVKSREIEEGNQ